MQHNIIYYYIQWKIDLTVVSFINLDSSILTRVIRQEPLPLFIGLIVYSISNNVYEYLSVTKTIPIYGLKYFDCYIILE